VAHVRSKLHFPKCKPKPYIARGMCCRFFWCWNRNSGDTGGLVAEDWATLEWEKLAYLSLIGLRPWFLDWVRCHVPAPASSNFSLMAVVRGLADELCQCLRHAQFCNSSELGCRWCLQYPKFSLFHEAGSWHVAYAVS
jgi:hypothetical protein